MDHSNHRLTQLIGSRICHDLISPIGAISNGLELIQMQSDASDTPEMALISESLNNAAARIRFYRIAFGMASDGQQVGAGEISAILSDMKHGSRVTFNWQAGEACARLELRMVFLALMCLETMLPHGGEVTIMNHDGRWHLRGAGQKIVTNADTWPAPSGDENIGAHQVQFALLPAALSASGRSLDLRHDDGAIELAF